MSESPKMNENVNDAFKEKNATDVQNAPVAENESKAESTIFVKHEYNTKKPVQSGSKKRLFICIVSVVLCIAIAGSIFLVNKFIPDSSSSDTQSTVSEIKSFSLFEPKDFVKESVVSVDGKQVTVDTNIKTVTFSNSHGEFSVLPHFVKAKETTSSSSSTTSGNAKYDYSTEWYIQNIAKEKIVSEGIAKRVTDCLTVSAINTMQNTFSSIEEYHKYYGMDKPRSKMVITFNDGMPNLTITVGSKLATGDSYYFTTSKDNVVYVVESSYADNYNCMAKEFANSIVIEKIIKNDKNEKYFNHNDEFARFDYIKVHGGVFGDKKYEFVMSDGVSADYMPYAMKAPYKRPASEEFIYELIAFAQKGLSAKALYSYDATKAEKDALGITDPRCVIELKAGDYHFKLTIGGTSNDDTDSYTAMVNGKTQIFGIEQSSIEKLIAASNDETKMFNPNFIMEDIYTINSVEFAVDGKRHHFKLKHTERADNEGVYDTEVKLENLSMDTLSFKLIYQRVLMLSLLEYVTKAEKTEPVLTVTFNYIGDTHPRVVEFTESPDDMYHYVAWVDGTPLGEVLKSSVDDITNCLNTYLNGGKVPDTW